MGSYENKTKDKFMRKIKDLIIKIRALFGVVHPTNPFIVDMIRMCRFAKDVNIGYAGGPEQCIQVSAQIEVTEWSIFVGLYGRELLEIVHGEPLSYINEVNAPVTTWATVCFHFPLTKFNFHDVNVIANFSQSMHVEDTNIKLGVEPCDIHPDKYFQPVGDGYFTLA